MEQTEIRILGVTDERTSCDCCGKTGLKVTVALTINGGDTLYYGRDCAGMVRHGKKSTSNSRKVEDEGRRALWIAERAAQQAAFDATPEGQAELARQAAAQAKSAAWLALNPGKFLVDYYQAKADRLTA